MLQSSSAGPSALGLDGGGLGFQNVRPSLALELDTYPNPPDPVQAGHVGLMLDGDINALPVAFATPPFALNDGVLRHVWIDYEAETSELRVYMAEAPQRPEAPLFSYGGLALQKALGPLVYAGFSASAGERFNDHDIVGETWVGVSTLPWCGP